MLQQFKQHIDTHFPFLHQKKLIVGVSGGIDSMVLAHLLHRLEHTMVLAHCNFMLRAAESDADEAFVMEFGKRLGVAVYTEKFDTKATAIAHRISIQMAARDLRYQWFATLIDTLVYDYILTAHHADDNLETFLINLSRGTGIEGLIGIPAQNQNIIRPLLPFSKAALRDYAQENHLNWREDSSNTDAKYLRNAIRHHVIPQLKTIQPNFSENVKKTLQYLSGSHQIIQQHITTYKETHFQKEENGYKIAVSSLRKLHPQHPYLYALFKDFGFTEWNDVAHMLYAPSGKQLFSATHRLVKDREYIYIQSMNKNTIPTEFIVAENTTQLTAPIHLNFNFVEEITDSSPDIIYVDKEKLKFPLIVRKWKKGDYFYPFGMQGKKKLSKFFKDEKYALIDKEAQWLLCTKDAIVWVIGKRADNRYSVVPKTKKILKISIPQ